MDNPKKTNNKKRRNTKARYKNFYRKIDIYEKQQKLLEEKYLKGEIGISAFFCNECKNNLLVATKNLGIFWRTSQHVVASGVPCLPCNTISKELVFRKYELIYGPP